MTGLYDSFQRPINYLRISVTDRCNLRCIYCTPSEGLTLFRHDEILSYEEIFTVVKTAADLGITRVRITGGEPLVRVGLPKLIGMIAGIQSITDISLTTNGTLLAEYAEQLKNAGLHRVNVSLDTLKEERFRTITRGKVALKTVLTGIETAKAAGLNPVKINMVVLAGTNDDEIPDFALKTINNDWNVRYIELMPFSESSPENPGFLSVEEIKKRLKPLGELIPATMAAGNGPAKYFRFPGARGTIGFITPVTEHFCFNCNRLRLTSDGKLRPCLLSDKEIDLKQALRQRLPNEELKTLIQEAVASKPLRHHLSETTTNLHRPMRQVGG